MCKNSMSDDSEIGIMIVKEDTWRQEEIWMLNSNKLAILFSIISHNTPCLPFSLEFYRVIRGRRCRVFRTDTNPCVLPACSNIRITLNRTWTRHGRRNVMWCNVMDEIWLERKTYNGAIQIQNVFSMNISSKYSSILEYPGSQKAEQLPHTEQA